MRDVSFILTGRDDGYTGDFITRFEIALRKNIEILSRHELDWEIIVVDYNPIGGKLLQHNEQLKSLLAHERVFNLIIDQSVVIDDGLPKNGFYEYFGKNCAALNSQGDLVSKIMTEIPAALATKDEILQAVNAKQYAWEPHHVHAALKNLKARGIVIQKGSSKFGLKTRQAA